MSTRLSQHSDDAAHLWEDTYSGRGLYLQLFPERLADYEADDFEVITRNGNEVVEILIRLTPELCMAIAKYINGNS